MTRRLFKALNMKYSANAIYLLLQHDTIIILINNNISCYTNASSYLSMTYALSFLKREKSNL